jgi:hypothetical protein
MGGAFLKKLSFQAQRYVVAGAMIVPSINGDLLQSEGGAVMKTAILIWMVLAALAGPAAARPAVGEPHPTFVVFKARNLWPVNAGVRLQDTSKQVAVTAPKTNGATAKSPEDESSPKPTDIIIETEHHH